MEYLKTAEELYVVAVKSGQRNLPEPLYWVEMGETLNLSWEKFREQCPEEIKEFTPFNIYMEYMYNHTSKAKR